MCHNTGKCWPRCIAGIAEAAILSTGFHCGGEQEAKLQHQQSDAASDKYV